MQEYWKMKLTLNQRKYYENMCEAFSKYKEHVFCNGLAPHEISEIYVAINNDHPELYHIPFNPQISQHFGLQGFCTELIIHNIYNRLQIRNINTEIDRVKSEIITYIPKGVSDYKKVCTVCDYVLQHTTYEINNQYNQNAASVLSSNKGQCSGIAKAVKLVLSWIGIESIVVNGEATDNNTGMSGPHSWNIVWIDNKTYHLDATFMLGANLKKYKPFSYLYLNYTDEEIAVNHQWDRKTTPRCDSTWSHCSQQMQASNIDSLHTEKTISSLYEFKHELKASIIADKHSFNFYSHIPINDSELMQSISNACKMVLNATDKSLQMSISIKDKMVFICW